MSPSIVTKWALQLRRWCFSCNLTAFCITYVTKHFTRPPSVKTKTTFHPHSPIKTAKTSPTRIKVTILHNIMWMLLISWLLLRVRYFIWLNLLLKGTMVHNRFGLWLLWKVSIYFLISCDQSHFSCKILGRQFSGDTFLYNTSQIGGQWPIGKGEQRFLPSISKIILYPSIFFLLSNSFMSTVKKSFFFFFFFIIGSRHDIWNLRQWEVVYGKTATITMWFHRCL